MLVILAWLSLVSIFLPTLEKRYLVKDFIQECKHEVSQLMFYPLFPGYFGDYSSYVADLLHEHGLIKNLQKSQT